MFQLWRYGLVLTAVVLSGYSILLAEGAAVVGKGDEPPSLVSLSSGALIVQKPQEYSGNWSAFWILDERANTGWAAPKGVVGNQVTVIELAQKALLTSLEFDTAGADGAGRAAKDVMVEISDTSATTGFSSIGMITLADHTDNQKFPTSAQVPGRWVRLTVKNNYGSPEYVEMMDFRARGKQLSSTAFPDVSGTYATNYGDMHLRQQGNSIVGCYEFANGLLAGAIDGSVMKLTWRQTTPSEGPAMMVFSGDGKQLFGLWWYKGGENGSGSQWTGMKKSITVGTCPHWSGDVQQQMANDLDQLGTTLVYGIVFDTDSDHIKDESRPTLDKIVALLKARADLKLAVEGHTDLTGNVAHNQELSERRAKSVIVYLSAAGIDGGRLSPVGYGATRPVASNETALGRAQNRRVVLTKK